MLLDTDRDRLWHIIEAVEKALSFSAKKKRDDLDGNEQLLLALVRCLEIIGEAAARISPQLRDHHPELPWRKMIGTRNRLIHAYFDINIDIVWRTVDEELVPLIAPLKRILSETPAD